MSAMPHQKEGTGLEEQESLLRVQWRLRAATAIAAIIVLISALLAFTTVPPQPLVLLLGIVVAVISYWAARIYWAALTKGRSGLPRGGPHEEQLAPCANCGSEYCVRCHERCPQCGSVHIRPNP